MLFKCCESGTRSRFKHLFFFKQMWMLILCSTPSATKNAIFGNVVLSLVRFTLKTRRSERNELYKLKTGLPFRMSAVALSLKIFNLFFLERPFWVRQFWNMCPIFYRWWTKYVHNLQYTLFILSAVALLLQTGIG